ncbi:unnamed protein product [Boreogadus saida]
MLAFGSFQSFLLTTCLLQHLPVHYDTWNAKLCSSHHEGSVNDAICPELSGHFKFLEADIKVKDVNDKGREKVCCCFLEKLSSLSH